MTIDTGGAYYAEGHTVYRQPRTERRADGSTHTTIGFPVCEVSRWVGDPCSAAEEIAAALNAQREAW